jgi:uncharacterized membrane protein YfcA
MPKSITFAVATLIVVLPISILTGLPSYFALQRLGFLKWWSVCSVGTAAGALVSATGITSGIPMSLDIMLGLTCALVTWLVLFVQNHYSNRMSNDAR